MSIYDSSTNSCSHFFCDKQHKVLTTLQPLPKITKRGMDVLRLLSVGYNSKQIAAELGIAIKTVDNHRQHLLSKMTAGSTAELVAIAVKAGLI
jgi:DNA-binding CsgD family transcriptional regulator